MLPKKLRIHYHIVYPFTILVLLTIFVAVSVNQMRTRQVLSAHTASLPVATATPIIAADMMLLVSVKFSGIGLGGNKKPKHPTRKVTAYVYDASEKVATGTGLLTYDGTNLFKGIIHLGNLSKGSYVIKLASTNALQALVKPGFQTLFPNQINSIPIVTFYQGDSNGDKVLTNDDISAVLSCFKKTNTCQANTDFNDDGKTDVTDYNLLLQSFKLMRSI